MSARGFCPSVAAPMPTGDGLLARFVLHDSVEIGRMAALCKAAQEYGNGIIEVTQRGNLQIRGLGQDTAPKFAQVVASLQPGQQARPALTTSPLLGLEPGEPFHSRDLVAALLDSFTRMHPALDSLGPKVSVLVDAGGALHLDAVSADIRLVATEGGVFRLALGGHAYSAAHVGLVRQERAPAAVEVLLRALAGKGSAARGKDLTGESVMTDLGSLLEANVSERPAPGAPATRAAAEPIGIHRLNDGTRAVGFGLPFGHATAPSLVSVVQSAADHGAASIRPAPGRALLAIGLSPAAASAFQERAASEDFLVDAQDPRRHVIACSGAPACAAARLPTRQLAPEIARATQTLRGSSNIVHLSGCSKGCAHAGIAALTIVGPDRIVFNGRASDPPHATISAAGLIADLTRLCGEL